MLKYCILALKYRFYILKLKKYLRFFNHQRNNVKFILHFIICEKTLPII